MNGVSQTEPNKIAESFNNFFSEIGWNLAKNSQMTTLNSKTTSKILSPTPCSCSIHQKWKSKRS